MFSPSRYQQIRQLSPQRVNLPSFARIPAFVKTREVRVHSPIRRSPPKYVIHNPQYLIRYSDNKQDRYSPAESKIVERQYSMHVERSGLQQQQIHLNEIIQQQQEQIITSESKVSLLQGEVNSWKQKFVELNAKYHQLQERFYLAEAELTQFKQQPN